MQSVRRRLMSSLFLLLLLVPTAQARELSLLIFPVLPEERTRELYQPLANYIGKTLNAKVNIHTTVNFMAHWELTKREPFDLILDGPHFVGYRLNHNEHRLLAKFPDQVSYTLVAHEDALVLEPIELVARRVATTPSPALGALRLNQIYPNPLRQPMIVETPDSITAAEYVRDGKAEAAIIPAGMVGNYPFLTTVMNTDQVPAPAITAGPTITDAEVEQLRNALLKADEFELGKQAVEVLNITGFFPADEADYRSQEVLLEGMWGL